MTTTDTGSEASGPEASAADAADDAPGPTDGAPSPTGAWPGGVDHKVVGKLFLLLALLFLLAGGVLAVVMRSQLAGPDVDLVTDRSYRQLFTLHGVFTVFFFLMPAWVGLATIMVPLQIGAFRLAFPRLQAFALWLTAAAGGLVVAAPFVTRLTTGWALSAPVPEGRRFRGDGYDLLVLGIGLLLVAMVVAAINLIVTVLKFRAPALTLKRVPMFTWSVLVSSSVLILALPVIIAGLLAMTVDRHYSGHVFNGFTGSRGGNPLLWPRLFWFGAYPALWALLLPALGVIAEIVAVFSGRPLVARHRAMAAMAAIGVLSFAGWGSEVPSLERARPVFAVGALLVLLPVASLMMGWVLTVVAARRDRVRRGTEGAGGGSPNPSVLHALGFVSVLAAGLGAGALSALNAGGRLHENYWAVGQQHLLFFGASTIGLVAGLYYWAPKLWGRLLPPRLGALEALALVGGVHLAFLPMLVLGLQDMGVHLSSYPGDDEWQPANLVATGGAFVLGLGALLVVLALVVGAIRGRRAGDDPWGGHTLEWATASPPPPHNFDSMPEIRSEAPLLDLKLAPPPPGPEVTSRTPVGAGAVS